jgi:hypothetical protein
VPEREMTKIKDYVVDYLIKSNFIYCLVKKTMFHSDIDNLLDDFYQEVMIAVLEQKDELWFKLYDSAIEKGTDLEYEARNYFSRVVFNTVKSTSSNAYKKLKRHSLTERIKNDVQWQVYRNSIEEPKGIMEQIKDFDE